MNCILKTVILFFSVALLAACASMRGTHSEDQYSSAHSILRVNGGELRLPNECSLEQLNYEVPSFAAILCDFYKDGDVAAIGFLNFRVDGLDKEKFILPLMWVKKTINGYQCGLIMEPQFSCYSEALGLVISSRDAEAVELFVRYQK